MFRVTRELAFSYGHRLLRYEGKCARLHGHNGRVSLTLGGADLDELGMVADFQVIRDRMGRWIEENLDHRMILHRDDPILPALQEQGESVYVVDWNPTAEHLARLLYEKARSFDLPVVCVEVWETPTCKATYSP